jgi:anti-sigma regulatory factor (Ser/Thr protein kinase)
VAPRNPELLRSPVPSLASDEMWQKNMLDDWPLGSYLELGALPSAVPCARLHARQILWEWGFADLMQTIELLVSELTTNAVRVSQSLDQASPVRLWLLSDKQRVIVSVWDNSPRPPELKNVSEDADGGRGLLLVDVMSTRWGWYPPRDIGGKCVWCEVACQEVQ